MYLFGGNGHCKVIIDIIKKSNEFLIEGIFDDEPKFDNIFDIKVFKTRPIEFFKDKQMIISIGNNRIRREISERINVTYLKAIHPSALISDNVEINKGTVVMAGVIINESVYVGKHCIINTGAIIEHDCIINDFVHISPRVSLAGNVSIGEGTHVGIASTIIQGIDVGKWVTIGAGSVIIKDVPDYAVVVGNPGKIIKYNKINE